MSDMDKITGLPTLPEGYKWEITKTNFNRQFLPGTYLGRSLTVSIVYGIYYAYDRDEYKKLAYGNAKSIRKAADRAMRVFKRKQAKKARTERLDKFIGIYPPKRLED